LNMTDHKCLGFLLDAGEPITPGQLAGLTGLTTGAITGIVDRLEDAGFVRRKRDPKDRRRVIIELNLDKVRRQVFVVRAAREAYERAHRVLQQPRPRDHRGLHATRGGDLARVPRQAAGVYADHVSRGGRHCFAGPVLD
jgi:predicted transcriptional regulator